MRKSYRFLLVVSAAAAVLAGCASVGPPAPTVSPPARPAPAGFRWGPSETYVHVASRAVFEPRYDDFVRGDKVVNYDKEARDVSVEYLWESRGALLTIYVYPTKGGEAAGRLLEAEYVKCRQEVYAYKTVTSVVAERTVTLHAESGDLPGCSGVFTLEAKFSGKAVEMLSFVLLFGKNEWYVLYRVSLPSAAVDKDTLDRIMRLPQAFDYGAIQ